MADDPKPAGGEGAAVVAEPGASPSAGPKAEPTPQEVAAENERLRKEVEAHRKTQSEWQPKIEEYNRLKAAGISTPPTSAPAPADALADRITRLQAQQAQYPDDPTVAEALDTAILKWHARERQRQCIGYVYALRPLAEAVAHCAASAATGDPRFPPVTIRELSDLQLDISVLSPLRPVRDPGEIQVGVHGLHISKDGHYGLLLPQVATDFRWDRETFLRQVCVIAGLPQDAWRRGAEIQVFTVERIEDGRPGGTEDA